MEQAHIASYWLKKKLGSTFDSIPRHKRAVIFPEPLWSIPFGLIWAYASLFQEKLGLSPVEIGLVSSVQLAVYTVASFFGGYLADRFGRRRAILVFDLMSWTAATLIWAVSRNFGHFLIAAILNGLGGVAEICFGCLLVEDTQPEDRLVIFSWLQVIDILSGLFVPFAGVLVGIYGVVAATRGMYWVAFASMTFMFFLRNALMRETSVGLQRMAETKGQPWVDSLRQIPKVLRFIAHDRAVLALFIVSVVTRVRYTVMGVYLALHLTRWIGLAPAAVAAFPTVSSLMIIIVTVLVIPLIGYSKANAKLTLGLLAAAAGTTVIALAPRQPASGLWWALAGMTVLGGATAIINPFHSTVWHNALPDESRAQILAVTAVVRMLLITPSGYLAGLLFAVSPVYVMLALAMLLAGAAVVLRANVK